MELIYCLSTDVGGWRLSYFHTVKVAFSVQRYVAHASNIEVRLVM